MDLMSVILALLLILFAYPLVFYPLILSLLPKNKIPLRNIELQNLSIIIAAYNEEEHIVDCINSILESDLEGLNLEILVGSDGSEDRTVEYVKSIKNPIVKIYDYPRQGKNQTLNKLVKESKFDNLLFIDADFRLKTDSIKKLLQQFGKLDVGIIICPIEMRSKNGEYSKEGESVYQKYESYIRRNESEIASCVNSLGSYIIKKDIFEDISSDKYCDDLHSILTSIKKGKRVYFDEQNKIYEVRKSNFFEDYSRRKRLVGGGLSTIFAFKELLSISGGWSAFFLWSHKLLRWFSSVFLLFAFILSLFMLDTVFGLLTAYTISVLIIISAIGFVLEKSGLANPLKLPLFFVFMNIGFIKGIMHYLYGSQNAKWSRKGLD
ncbi:MAG: glycosyltransferase [Ignavibacteriae bacterium]|nr:glycosyltransferase [Ignavibacteriota bacterium]MCB9221084.1 glycosyltransferase [Ignavibacteria bacterium]